MSYLFSEKIILQIIEKMRVPNKVPILFHKIKQNSEFSEDSEARGSN